MSTQNDELKFAPEIRTLAYAMQSMSHTEICQTIAEIDDKAHKTGMKNGRFGYLKKSEVLEAIEKLRLDDISSSTEDYAHYTGNNTALWKLKQALGLDKEEVK